MSNATYLFEKPKRNHRNSESFWTTFFALYLIYLSKSGQNLNIPAYKYRKRNGQRCFDSDGNLIVPKDLDFHDVVVEGRITQGFVTKLNNPIPTDLLNLQPDIIIQTKDNVLIIEIKTIGSGIDIHKRERYEQLRHFLQDNGYYASLYFLISAGHEGSLAVLDADSFELQEFKILLWEQVFKHLDKYNSNSFLIKCLGNITPYYITEEEYM